MLYGAVLLQVFQRPVEAQQVALVDGGRLRGEQLHLIPPQESLKKHIEKHTHLAAAIEAIQFLVEEGEDVAHAVGTESEVAGIHLRPKSAGISPQLSVSHFRISVV